MKKQSKYVQLYNAELWQVLFVLLPIELSTILGTSHPHITELKSKYNFVDRNEFKSLLYFDMLLPQR